MKNKIYNSPIFSLFVFLIITIIFCVGFVGVEIGETLESKYNIYSIEFNYYGMDASKMEELITIPLEEKLISINGILEYKSDIQYSKSTTTLYFSKKENSKNIYLTLRNIVDNLYNNLPGDVQKPRIYSSDSNSKSVICIAFFADENKDSLRNWIDLNLKKRFESIEGVSEVLVTGGSQKEILIEFDSEKAASALQNPSAFATIIQDGNSIYPSTKFRYENYEENLNFNTKIKNIENIKELPVKISEGYTTLGYLADIDFKAKTEDEIVRLNGTECISIAIKSASDGNSILISKECKKILKEYDYDKYKYSILYDTGEKQQKLINDVLISLLQSFICIILILPLFFSKNRTTILIILLLPISIIWTVGLLKFTSFSINQYTISGLCIALGLIVDPALVISEICEKSFTKKNFLIKLEEIKFSIISAALTTIIAFIPLLFLDNIVSGVKNIAVAIIYMIITSMILVLVFFPAFIYSNSRKKIKHYALNKNIEKKYLMFTYKTVLFSTSKRRIISFFYIILVVLPLFIFIFSGKNLSLTTQNNVIYCSIDYEPNISNKYIDKDIESLIEQIKNSKYVKFVRSESKLGNVEFEIGYHEKFNRDEVLLYLDSLKNYVPEGYFYVPNVKQKFQKKQNSFEIACIGDDSFKCREYAKTAVKKLNENHIGNVVLNFKKDESFYEFRPDKTILAKNNLTIESVSSTLRWLMFGPVADKWIQEGKEYDIRIIGKDVKKFNIERISNLYIPIEKGSININSLGVINKISDISKIYRKNGRRAAYFTVETVELSTDKARTKIEEILKTIELENGYGFDFAYEIKRLSENYILMFKILLLSIIFIYILMVILTEDFLKSLKIISIIPISIVLPLLIKFFTNNPLELGDIIGMIILCGLSINNAIYISESHFSKSIYKVRNKIKSIIVTSLTTILSSVPLYIFSESSFSKAIAFFMIFGILNSFIVSIFMYPVIEDSNKKKLT